MIPKTTGMKPPEKVAPANKNKPAYETRLVRQRLQNLIQLAISIGQREGLIGNHLEEVKDLEGGNNVNEKRGNRGIKAVKVGENKTGDQERK